MANRSEEKEAARKARLEREQAEQKAAARKRAFGLIGGILLAVVAVGAIVLVISSGGGSDAGDVAEGSSADVREAAAAAGCEFKQLDSEGRDHIEEAQPLSEYGSNPPASGPHNPVAAQDGYYSPGNEPDYANWLHALEHGRVIFQFKQGTAQGDIDKLRDLANEELQETAGYHTLVHQNNTNMPKKFAAVAWTRYLACDALGEPQLDAMREFRTTYTDQAPELIP